MRKILTAAAAALTLAGGLVATTAPAQAQTRGHGGNFHGGSFHGGGWRGGSYRGGYYRGGSGWGYGAAALGGLALGAALASPGYGYGYGPYYDGSYGGDYGGSCVGTQQVWDPYYGGYTVRRYYYAC